MRLSPTFFALWTASTVTCLAAGNSATAVDGRLCSNTVVKTDAASREIAGTQRLDWCTGLDQAKVKAKAEGKLILLLFHGSDWCPPCVKLQRQVIASDEFARFASQNLVLVDVDFPEKGAQSEELRRANQALKLKFNLSPEWGEGFPTLVLLNPAGDTVYQETGYAGGGPAEVLSKLQSHVSAPPSTAVASGFRNLSIDEFSAMMANQANVVLDVRTPQEFQAGHLAGAINLDVNSPAFKAKAAELDKTKAYLVHCASGGRSKVACEALSSLGFANLYNLPDGYRGWVRAGRPVSK